MLLLGIISYGTQEFHPNYYSFGRNFTGNGLIMVETEGKKILQTGSFQYCL
jgi:hypothetical protein